MTIIHHIHTQNKSFNTTYYTTILNSILCINSCYIYNPFIGTIQIITSSWGSLNSRGTWFIITNNQEIYNASLVERNYKHCSSLDHGHSQAKLPQQEPHYSSSIHWFLKFTIFHPTCIFFILQNTNSHFKLITSIAIIHTFFLQLSQLTNFQLQFIFTSSVVFVCMSVKLDFSLTSFINSS